MAMLLMALTLTGFMQAPESGAADRVEALLTAMGGRDAWTRARFVHVRATHRDADTGRPYDNQIWNDFTSPRVRIEAVLDGVRIIRGIDGTTGWHARNDATRPMTGAQIAADRTWWESNVYRTLHRLASNDATIVARAIGDRRLEIHRVDGSRLNWFVLNGAGEPILFGTGDNEHGTAFGPLVDAPSGIRHWRWGSSADGTFQFEIHALIAAERVPDGVSFTSR